MHKLEGTFWIQQITLKLNEKDIHFDQIIVKVKGS